MKLFVSSSKTAQPIYDLSASDTVAELKRRIEAKGGPSVASQRLVYAGRVLEDAATLQESNVLKEATVVCHDVVRAGEEDGLQPPGGFDAPSSLQPADRATTSYTAPEYKAKDYVASEYKAKEYLANEYKAKEYMAPEYKAKVYVAVGYGAADADAVEPSKER